MRFLCHNPIISHRLFAVIIGVAGLLAAAPNVVCGQGYANFKQYPIDKKYGELKYRNEQKKRKNELLKNRASLVEAKPILDEYYYRFWFPAMTREEFAPIITDLRIEFLRDVAAATDPKLRQYFLQTGYKFVNIYLKEKALHPAVHANAVILLGELNKSEAVGNTKPPVPHPLLTKRLAEIVKDPQIGEVPRAVALVELLRHVRLRNAAEGSDQVAGPERQFIASVALDLAKQDKPTASQSSEALEWLRTRAVELLGQTRMAGTNQEISKLLLGFVGDASVGFDLRTQALQALALIDRKSLEVDSAQLEFATARLVTDLLRSEVRAIQEALSGPGRLPMTTDDPGAPGNRRVQKIKDELTITVRRRLLPQLLRVQQSLLGDPKKSLVGLESVADPAVFDKSIAAIKAVIDILSDPESTMVAIGDVISEQEDILDDEYPDPRRRRRRGAGPPEELADAPRR